MAFGKEWYEGNLALLNFLLLSYREFGDYIAVEQCVNTGECTRLILSL